LAQIVRISSSSEPLAPEAERLIREAVEKGSVIVYPTDTIYGLGCSAHHEASIRRVAEIKKRSLTQTFSMHLGHPSEIGNFALIENEDQQKLIDDLLPGPYTLIMYAGPETPPGCISQSGKVGIRVPDSPIFMRIYEVTQTPLIGTSINHSGQPALNDIRDIKSEFGDIVDLIIESAIEPSGASSTVLDVTTSPPRAIRGKLPPQYKL